jgi:hypothetical protein
MINPFKKMFEAVLESQQKQSKKNAISLALSRNYLYEDKGLDALHPDLKTKAILLMERMKQLGKPIMVYQTYRSAKEQNEKYARGRTSAGSIITNAQGLQSYHQYGLAVDFVFEKYWWRPPASDWWITLMEEAEKLRLESGGRWALRDYPHIQYRPLGVTWRELQPYFKRI